MLAILFPHMYEEIDYLMPQEEDSDMEAAVQPYVDNPYDTQSSSNNAIAGPSRLG